MFIIIVGAGKMGQELCASLSKEGHELILIEQDSFLLDGIYDNYKISGILGNGSFPDIQKKANVSACDMFISVTDEDETNIVACVVAKKMGAAHTIARVRTPEYAQNMNFAYQGLGVSWMINPEREAAREIYRVLQFPAAYSIEPFEEGRVNMVELSVIKDSLLDGISMMEFRKQFPGLLICSIQDENGSKIPSGETILRADQHFYVTGQWEEMRSLYNRMGAPDRIGSVMIIGGGRTCRYLLSMLENSSKKIKVIENNLDSAHYLANEFSNCEIIYGDGTDHDLLIQENIDQYEGIVSLTGIDEENIILSMFASKRGVKRTITKINRTALIPLALEVGIQTIATPTTQGATAILRIVRSIENAKSSSNKMEALYRMNDKQVEVMQFQANESFIGLNFPLMDVGFQDEVLIALIIRQGEVIFPTGYDSIQDGDHVLVVTKAAAAKDLNDLLKK